MHRSALAGTFLFSLCLSAAPLPAQTVNVNVAAGDRDRADALVTFKLPPTLVAADDLRLVDVHGQVPTPVAIQRDPASGKLWWFALGAIPAGTKRSYRLERGAAAAVASLTVADSERTIQIRQQDRPLLQYNKAHVEPAAGVNPKMGRSAHLHPVWTPSGAIITDELPPDHLHQSGIFLAFTKTKFEDRDVDFWNLGAGKGRVRYKNAKTGLSGPVFATFHTEQEHVDLSADNEKAEIGQTAGGKVALIENWEVRAWSPGADAGYWLLDIGSSIRCATDNPLLLPEYHYGGMAIRAARPWVPKEVTFLTSEGDNRIKGNHTRARWCDIFGQIDGQPAGIALFTSPTNFRFPEPLRIHPTMPYMVYTPSFLGDWSIAPGTIHNSSYRFIIHDGQLSPETLEGLWQNFAKPLEAVLE